jgi:hypothetical protein
MKHLEIPVRKVQVIPQDLCTFILTLKETGQAPTEIKS